MSAKGDGGDFDGTIGQPQMKIDFGGTADRLTRRESKPTYDPSPKHDPKHTWSGASVNPIKTHAEGQRLLESGFKNGKQIYNITDDGEIVVFQPANTSNNAYHSYGTDNRANLPAPVLRWLLTSGHISKSDYNKLVNNKPRRKKK